MIKVFQVVIIVNPTVDEAAKGKTAEVLLHQVVTAADDHDAAKKVLIQAKAALPEDPNRTEVQVRLFN